MRVSLKWLREYVDINLSPQELAGKLTMAGTEVSEIRNTGGDWDKVVIGQITKLEQHPNADRLLLATVNVGSQEITVVTGAPNLHVGDKAPFAFVGARLYDPYGNKIATLKPANIRGIRSEGMVCSEKELQISDEHTGIMILPGDAPVGMPLAEYLGDTILELDVTPNRPDLLSMLGVAHEVAALTRQTVRAPDLGYTEKGEKIQRQVEVKIEDVDLCSRYTASLITNITVAPSPKWMRDRLIAAGMRPINNIVDITNYVMMEYGQPLHAFDFDTISQATIIVRRARMGETLVTLDGDERKLDRDMLLIADPDKPVGLAGVMGGANSEVGETTSSILLESANFNPVNIRRTSTKLMLRSEASLRFERGISPELPIPALRRATQLMVELADGWAAKGVVDEYPGRKDTRPILLTSLEVKRQLGMDLPLERAAHVFSALDFKVESLDTMPEGAENQVAIGPEGRNTKGLLVTPPFFRSDIRLVEDAVEEIARIVGYDAIPTTMLSGAVPAPTVDAGLQMAARVRDLLTCGGLQEVVNYSLTNLAALELSFVGSGIPAPQPIKIANPMTFDHEFLRTTLRPGIFQVVAANLRHEDRVHIFEVGSVFIPRDGDLPEERRMVVGLLCGDRENKTWLTPGTAVDFFDAKGVVEDLLGGLGLGAAYEPTTDLSLHGGKAASIVVGGERIGVLGEVDPRVLENFDIGRPCVMFEADLEKLLAAKKEIHRFESISRYPATERDIAMVVDVSVLYEKMLSIIGQAPLVKQVRLFDVYTGAPLPAGKKSIAFSITFQSPDRTLTDEEVNRIQEKTIRNLERQVGATLRS